MTEGELITYNSELVVIECCACGIAFAMPEPFKAYTRKHRGHKTEGLFYCPQGHAQRWTGETDEQRHKRELAEERRMRERLAREFAARGRILAAMPHGDRDLAETAARMGPAQRGAFWKGVRAYGCGEDVDTNPYPDNRGGFREAWTNGWVAADERECST